MMLNSLMGATIGAMIRAACMAAEVVISDDSIVVKLKTGETPVDAKEGVKKTMKKRRRSRKDLVTCNGETRSIEDWAKREKVTLWTIFYRLDKFGTPLGSRKPTDKDKMILGS